MTIDPIQLEFLRMTMPVIALVEGIPGHPVPAELGSFLCTGLGIHGSMAPAIEERLPRVFAAQAGAAAMRGRVWATIRLALRELKTHAHTPPCTDERALGQLLMSLRPFQYGSAHEGLSHAFTVLMRGCRNTCAIQLHQAATAVLNAQSPFNPEHGVGFDKETFVPAFLEVLDAWLDAEPMEAR